MNVFFTLDSSILSNFILTFKQKNIPFQYILTIIYTSLIKNIASVSNFNFNASINSYFKNFLLYNEFEIFPGLKNFFSDFLLFFFLKNKNNYSDLDFTDFKHTKGIFNFIYPNISHFKEKPVFLFFFQNILKKNNNFFEIEELLQFKDFQKFSIEIILETNKVFKMVNLAGVIDSEFYFYKNESQILSKIHSSFEFLYHFNRKKKKIKESVNITRHLKNKTKLIFNIEESIKNNTFENIIFSCEYIEICHFVRFYQHFVKKKKNKVNFSKLFKNYITNDWISNLSILNSSLAELGCYNFMCRFFKKRNLEFSSFSNILEINLKKSFFDNKKFPQKFYNCDIELSKIVLFFDFTHYFYLGCISSYLQNNSFLFFSKFVKNFPDQLNFYKFIKKNGLFFDLKGVFFSDNLILLKIISEILNEIDMRLLFENKITTKKNILYIKDLTDTDLIFSISFFSISKYSKKIPILFIDTINFYFGLCLVFEHNILIWKSLELSIISFIICIFEKNINLNIKQLNLWKKNFNIIFSFIYIKEKFLQHNIKKEKISIYSEISNYIKIRIMEIFLISSSILTNHIIYSEKITFLKKIVKFATKIEFEFFLYCCNKNLMLLFCIVLGILTRKSSYELFTNLKDIQIISERKIQKLFNLSVLIFNFLGTSNIEIIKIIINEYKKYEIQKLSKLERILLLKNVKIKNFFTINNFETINEQEVEQTFLTSRKLLELGILGISVLTFGDEIASHMVMRIYSYFLMFSSSEIRRITTLAIGFLYISKPTTDACEYMIKLTNDNDWIIIKNAIFSLGLIGAGTGNTRIQSSLKCLADYYSNKIEKLEDISKIFKSNFNIFAIKVQSLVFIIRISQGLVNSITKKVLFSTFFVENFLNSSKIFSLIYILYGFFYSKFIGFNSISILIFLLGLIVKTSLIMNIDNNFKIKSVKFTEKNLASDKYYTVTPILTINSNERLIFDTDKSFSFR